MSTVSYFYSMRILHLNLCFIPDFLQKDLWNKQKTQATGLPHQAIKGFISERNFHNIRRQLDKKELPHKRLVKTTTTTNWKCKPHQAKGFIRRNVHNIRRKMHKKGIVDCVKKWFYVFIDYLITIYNLVTAMRLSVHVFDVQKINCTTSCMLSLKHEHF